MTANGKVEAINNLFDGSGTFDVSEKVKNMNIKDTFDMYNVGVDYVHL